MPKYTVCLAQDVTLSATYEVEADNPDEAEEKAREQADYGHFDADWYLDPDLSWIDDEDGNTIMEG